MKKYILVISLTMLSAVLFRDAAAQLDFARTLQRKLDLYYARHVPVKIHLSFNRPQYFPGDTAFYKAWFVSASDSRAIEGRQILHVDLVDSHGARIHQSRILVIDGAGANQLRIPEDIAPGFYTVVAYHAGVMARDPSLFFQTTLAVSGSVAFDRKGATSPMRFFAEGGHFISGITNKIVVTGPANSSGSVFSIPGKKVASFALDSAGLGLFFLTPVYGQKYFARLDGDGGDLALPEGKRDGVGILATVPENGAPIRVTVQIPEGSSIKSKGTFLLLTAHDKVYYSARLSFRDRDFLVFSLPQDHLPGGVARLTIFKEDGTPLSERLVFINGTRRPNIGLRIPSVEFGTRSQIPLDITVAGSTGEPLAAAFSVSIYREDLLPNRDHDNTDIVSNVKLYSDLRGSMVARQDHFHSSALDSYLITQEWNRFSWKEVWLEALPEISFRRYLHLEGTVSSTDERALPDSTIVTFFLQKSVMTYVVTVDPAGTFEFSLLMDFFGEEEIYYRIESRGEVVPNARVNLSSEPTFGHRAPELRSRNIPDEFYADATRRKAIVRAYAYDLRQPGYNAPLSLNRLIEEEVAGADAVINLKDYFLFPTMSETLREITPFLRHRKERSRDVLRLFFDDRNRFAEDAPLIIIDGVICDNTSYFLNLEPAEVLSISLINTSGKLRVFGAVGKNGIVLVDTKIPGHADMVPRSDHTFRALGLTAPVPAHFLMSNDERVPDLRSALYWNPEATTDTTGTASVRFRASDVTGVYKIKIEGFTGAGEPFIADTTFQIVYDAP